MSLKSDIRKSERSIAQRRDRLGVAVDGVKRAIRKHMVSPGALVTAGLVGAALHRGQRQDISRILALLEATNTGLLRLLTLSTWARSATAIR